MHDKKNLMGLAVTIHSVARSHGMLSVIYSEVIDHAFSAIPPW